MDTLYQDLLKELECPICTNYMSPPIKQCATGHSICNTCKKLLPRCPLCREQFTDGKNLSLEAVARRVQYPCINEHIGCMMKLPYDTREAHEENCLYNAGAGGNAGNASAQNNPQLFTTKQHVSPNVSATCAAPQNLKRWRPKELPHHAAGGNGPNTRYYPEGAHTSGKNLQHSQAGGQNYRKNQSNSPTHGQNMGNKQNYPGTSTPRTSNQYNGNVHAQNNNKQHCQGGGSRPRKSDHNVSGGFTYVTKKQCSSAGGTTPRNNNQNSCGGGFTYVTKKQCSPQQGNAPGCNNHNYTSASSTPGNHFQKPSHGGGVPPPKNKQNYANNSNEQKRNQHKQQGPGRRGHGNNNANKPHSSNSTNTSDSFGLEHLAALGIAAGAVAISAYVISKTSSNNK